MAEEVGIVMSLYDKVSPNLKAIAGNSKAFDKTLDELEASLKAYDKAQKTLTDTAVGYKKQLAETEIRLKEAKKNFKALNDEASSNAMAAAIDDQDQLRRKLIETEAAIKANDAAYKDLYKNAKDTANALRKSETENLPGNGSDTGGQSLLSRLGAAGATAMVGDLLSQAVGTFAGSAFGSVGGNYVASALSSAGMGASIGTAIAPGIGTAIGAALGGLSGLINGAMDQYTGKDEAFKGYVRTATEGVLQERAAGIVNGSGIAAQREQDAIAFNQLLGDGVGDQYLKDLRTLAAKTPMEYGDLTGMSRALATGFGGDPGRMLDLMSAIGDAGSAVGIDAGGMTEMAKALSRMESSNKASLEYLNIFQERGVNAVGMLSEGLGKTQGEIYDMISKGKIQGVDAVKIIQAAMENMYDGAMAKQSETFSGLSSTLADAKAEMDNAYGIGYNDTRKQGLQDEIDYLSGESGAIIQQANQAMGAFQASLENSKEQYVRQAMDAVIGSDDYKALLANGSDESMAKAGEMLMAAKVRGQSEYNSSYGARLMLESELSLAAQIREDSSSNDAYWDAGYHKGEQYTRGLSAKLMEDFEVFTLPASYYDRRSGSSFFGDKSVLSGGFGGSGKARPSSNAFGLHRVPYDNYPLLAHQDERLLTANQARQQDRGGTGSILITGNEFNIREEADVGRVAAEIMDQILAAQMTDGGVM